MNIVHWLSPDVMRSLGWTLLHFFWQGTALAALAAVSMALSRRASVRYALGVGTLILMLAVPVATFVSYLQIPSTPLPAMSWSPVAANSVAPHSVLGMRVSPVAASTAPDAFVWLVEAWLLGVVFFSLRCVGGFVVLERMRRQQALSVQGRLLATCLTLQQRLRLNRFVRYCECKWLDAPAVIGWFRPIVLLPMTALTGLSEEQLRAVIAHELAHIKRLDAFVNAFQIVAETVLFYHPAVWWLNQRIRAERENSCDDIAIALCGNAVEYARALTLMEEWRSAPAMAMAANRGPLAARIARLLGISQLRSGVRGLGLTASILCLSAALLAGNAIFGLARPKANAQAIPAAAFGSTAQSAPAALASAQPVPQGKPSPAAKASAASAATSAQESTTAGSYIDSMKAAGLGDLTVDQLVAMKIQNITADYVRSLREQGFHPDVNSLIAMKIQGVTADYIRGLKAAGLNFDEEQLVALKIQGANPTYLTELQQAGVRPDADQLIAMRIQNVTPDLVKSLHAIGLNPDPDQIIALKVQNIDPAYAHGLYELKLQPSVDDLIAMKIQGVTPEYVQQVRALGLQPSTDELVAMRVQNVTPDYIKALQSAGFKVNVEEIVGAKIQGITPEFIELAHKHGFKDITLDKLIQLKRIGILDQPASL